MIRGARWPGDIAVEDGWITAVGDVPAEPGEQVLRVDGDIVTAGLVNTHHHLYQWLTRGQAVGCDLFGWLTELYPVWGRIEVDDVAAAAVVGLGELALSGCTTAFDHHYLVPRGDDRVFDATVAAARSVGVRLHVSRGSMDLGESRGGLPPDHVVEEIDAILASTERIVREHHDGESVSVVVAPCSPFSVTPELMRESAALARRHGLRLHTHLAETVEENAYCLEHLGRRPLDLMERVGLAGRRRVVRPRRALRRRRGAPDRRGRRRGRALPVVQRPARRPASPGSPTSRRPGRRSGSASTGSRPTRSAGLFPELRQALYAARLRGSWTGSAPGCSCPADALRLATSGGARCLGRDDIGRLEVGARADLAVWPGDDLADIADPIDRARARAGPAGPAPARRGRAGGPRRRAGRGGPARRTS